jgi:hypothetical protein
MNSVSLTLENNVNCFVALLKVSTPEAIPHVLHETDITRFSIEFNCMLDRLYPVLLILAYIELLVATNDLQTDTEKQILI